MRRWYDGLGKGEQALFVATVAGAVVTGLIGGLFGLVPLVFADDKKNETRPGASAAAPSPTTGPPTLVATSAAPSETPSATPSEPESPSPGGSTEASPDPGPPSGPVLLSDLEPVTGRVDTQPTRLGGEEYVTPVRQDLRVCGKAEADYDLGRRFARFTAKIGLNDTYETPKRRWTFAVYVVGEGGEKTLFKKIVSFGQVVPIDLSVKGALRLRISVEWIDTGGLVTCSPYNEYNAVWADARLLP